MMKKCKGCGALLQSTNQNKEGYVQNTEHDLCERCFKIINYNEYKVINKDNQDFIKILKKINDTNDLVILLVDLFNIPSDIKNITKYLNNDILLVLTKRDILPSNDEKLLNYSQELNINFIDKIIVSSNKNYNFDLLFEYIKKYQKTANVYLVGFTNSGKSTLINKFAHNYSDNVVNITTSNLPSTTLNTLEIKINDDLVLIDTPGIIDAGNIINYIDAKTMKKIIPKKTIKPITYQIKSKQYILIEDLVKIECSSNNLTFYISNNLKIERLYKNIDINLNQRIIKVKRNEDLVITGLGFIKIGKNETIKIWVNDKVDVYTRKSLI